MNRDQLQGKWKQVRGTVRQRWGTLAADPIAFAGGTRDRLEGRSQEQRGASHQEANRQLAAFLRRNRYWWDLSKH